MTGAPIEELAVDAEVRAKLASIRFDYETERAHRTASAPPPPDSGICRYCGKARQLYAGSLLDGHANCMVGDAFKRRLAAAMRDPRLTYAMLSSVLGVGGATIRAWFRAARALEER